MRRFAIASTIALLVLLSFSSFFVNAEEQKPKYPPLEELIDITDKVAITEATSMKFDVWHFDKETPPPLPDAAKICKAKEGWDSYSDGAKVPTRNYWLLEPYEHEYYEKNMGKVVRASIYLDQHCVFSSRTCRKLAIQPSIENLTDRPASFSFAGKHDYFPKKYSNFMKGIPRSLGYNSGDRYLRTCADGYILFEKRQPIQGKSFPPHVFPIESVWKGTFPSGKLEIKRTSLFRNHEFITSWGRAPFDGYTNSQSFDYVLLYNTNSKEMELYGENLKLIKTVPMFKKKYKETNIWHSPYTMPARAFPYVVIFEDNWGYEREKQIFPFHNPGRSDSLWGELSYEFFIRSDNPLRRSIVFNVMTGKAEWEVNGVFSTALISREIMHIPNVAKGGQLGYSLVRNGVETAFLPYSSFLPQEYWFILNASTMGSNVYDDWRMLSPFAFSDCILSEDNVSIINFEKTTLSRPVLNADLDNSHFPPYLEYLANITIVLASKDFNQDGRKLRDFIIMTGKEAKHPFTFLKSVSIPTDILGKIEGDCFAWMTERGLEIYINGKVFLVKGVVK